MASKPNPLPQGIMVERDIFSFWSVLLEFVWLDIIALFLEGFLGIAMVGDACRASFEEQGAAGEIQLPASETAVRMKTALKRSPGTNKSLLFLCWSL